MLSFEAFRRPNRIQYRTLTRHVSKSPLTPSHQNEQSAGPFQATRLRPRLETIMFALF